MPDSHQSELRQSFRFGISKFAAKQGKLVCEKAFEIYFKGDYAVEHESSQFLIEYVSASDLLELCPLSEREDMLVVA